MKYLFYFIFIGLFIAGCSKKDEAPAGKFEAYKMDLNAYQLDTCWEVNAPVQIKNFGVLQDGGNYSLNVSYSVDVTSADGRKAEGIFKDVFKNSTKDKPEDAQLDVQFNLSNSYKSGKLIVTVNITDEISKSKSSITKPLTLE